MPIDHDLILEIASKSAIRSYRWKNRGRAPSGYVNGMAIAFAEACEALASGDSHVGAIAAEASGDAGRDVLDWYADVLASQGLSTASPQDRLVAVFVILLGLGMRESSGKHCEGRDMSTDNVTAETAEAGLFQVSHNSIKSHPQLQPLFDQHRGRDDLLTVFDDDVKCSTRSWTDWGSGPGREFQSLTKQNPKFALLYAGILLRRARKHWGPINRKEVEVTRDGLELFDDVMRAIEE